MVIGGWNQVLEKGKRSLSARDTGAARDTLNKYGFMYIVYNYTHIHKMYTYIYPSKKMKVKIMIYVKIGIL